jgi:hypothetical protein
MTTELIRFTHDARGKPQTRYTALMGLLAAEEGLADSYHRQPSAEASSGVNFHAAILTTIAQASALISSTKNQGQLSAMS